MRHGWLVGFVLVRVGLLGDDGDEMEHDDERKGKDAGPIHKVGDLLVWVPVSVMVWVGWRIRACAQHTL